MKPKPNGRPSKYTEQVADFICDRIATSSDGLKIICAEIPINLSTVFEWLQKHDGFSNKYARAKELQADYLADEIIEIADKYRKMKIEYINAEGSATTIQDNVQRSRLQVDARKWKASKLAPKKYGDKIETEHSGSIGINPTIIKWGDKEIKV